MYKTTLEKICDIIQYVEEGNLIATYVILACPDEAILPYGEEELEVVTILYESVS